MTAFRFVTVFMILLWSLGGASYARGGIYGCWNNVSQVPANPDYSPLHKNTTAQGDIICFKNNGVITTVQIGGFEALGAQGRFSYRAGQLVVKLKDLADGWPFAFKIDHCNIDLSAEQLTISGCKGREGEPKSMVLHKQTAPPDTDGVAGGYSQ